MSNNSVARIKQIISGIPYDIAKEHPLRTQAKDPVADLAEAERVVDLIKTTPITNLHKVTESGKQQLETLLKIAEWVKALIDLGAKYTPEKWEDPTPHLGPIMFSRGPDVNFRAYLDGFQVAVQSCNGQLEIKHELDRKSNGSEQEIEYTLKIDPGSKNLKAELHKTVTTTSSSKVYPVPAAQVYAWKGPGKK